MTRYSLKPLPRRSDLYEVAVGWDPALETYFLVVFGAPIHGLEPEVRHWSGGRPRQISNVEDLRQEVKDYATLEPKVISQLQADQTMRLAETPWRMSKIVLRLLGLS